MRNHSSNQFPQTGRRSPLNRRTFELEVSGTSAQNMTYFVRQETGYYNTLVEQLTPRLRAFPHDLLSMRDREKRLWEVCAEHGVNPQKLALYPVEQWPEHLRQYGSLIKEADGTNKVAPAHLNIIAAAGSPARIHPTVRRNMANEILRYIIGQADVFNTALATNSEGLKSPMQMLNAQTVDSKRHLQIPSTLVKMIHNKEENRTEITIPYSKDPLFVYGYDLTDITYKMAVIRSPHPTYGENKWFVDLKEISGYALNLTDHNERRRLS